MLYLERCWFTAIAARARCARRTPHAMKRAAHAAGLQVAPWTADTPEDWDRLVGAQVDAIITDDPAALLERLGRRRVSPLRLRDRSTS
jgi:glycerophosphoryl diester phosphodiesterase